MIFGIYPEDRHGWDSVLVLDAFGEFQCGNGLQKREERTAEQACLLSRDDRDGPRVPQTRRRSDCRLRRRAPALLCLDDVGDPISGALVLLGSGDCLTPGAFLVWIASKEIGDLGEVERVVRDQWPDPGKAADVDGNARSR